MAAYDDGAACTVTAITGQRRILWRFCVSCERSPALYADL